MYAIRSYYAFAVPQDGETSASILEHRRRDVSSEGTARHRMAILPADIDRLGVVRHGRNECERRGNGNPHADVTGCAAIDRARFGQLGTGAVLV